MKIEGLGGKISYNPPKNKNPKKFKDFLRLNLLDLSTLTLILSNIITIVIAVYNNWNVFTLMWVYLFQSIIIGIFTFIKIRNLKNFTTQGLKINNKQVPENEETKKSASNKFLKSFLFFHFIYIFFLLTFSNMPIFLSEDNLILKNIPLILLSIIIFFFNHLFSYIYNREKDSEKVKILGEIIFHPFSRILPMHLTIIFMGFVSVFADANATLLIFFFVIKTIADVIMHEKEHEL